MQLNLTDNALIITLNGLQKLWAFKVNPILIELSTIQEVSLKDPKLHWKTIRAPGTSVPKVFHAGTFYTPLGKEFWYFRWNRPKLILSLEDAQYQRVIISPDHPDDWAAKIQAQTIAPTIQ